MNVTIDAAGVIRVTLSRRNLRTLLLKLDEPESAKTIMKHTDAGLVFVRAEDDEGHYDGRRPGEMHPREETRLNNDLPTLQPTRLDLGL